MRISVCFQLKRSKSRSDGKFPLYLRCTMSGLRFETSTGFFLEKSSWIESAQLADGKSEEIKVINNRIAKIRTKIQDIYNQLDSLGGHAGTNIQCAPEQIDHLPPVKMSGLRRIKLTTL